MRINKVNSDADLGYVALDDSKIELESAKSDTAVGYLPSAKNSLFDGGDSTNAFMKSIEHLRVNIHSK